MAAVGGLTAGKGNGRISAVDQKRLTAVMRGLGSGELKHPRFTKEEAAASEGTEHERLWNFILSLESPEVHAGGGEGVDGSEGGEHSQGGGWLGQLRRMATRYGRDPQEVKASEHKYLDKGAESTVYATSGKTVVKVRKLPAYSLDGVKEALAKIVYHNYLFPKDAYTLHDIAVWDNNGYDQFYLILEQPLVTPKTDAEGNIIAPSEGQIFEALNKTRQRFIDPRVDFNDPGAGFSVSKFGKRKIVDGPASFEGAPSEGMEGDLRLSRGYRLGDSCGRTQDSGRVTCRRGG